MKYGKSRQDTVIRIFQTLSLYEYDKLNQFVDSFHHFMGLVPPDS